MNPWKLFSIIFILLIILLSFILYSQQFYTIGSFKIRKSTLNDISETLGDKPFKVCDTYVPDNCLTFARIK